MAKRSMLSHLLGKSNAEDDEEKDREEDARAEDEEKEDDTSAEEEDEKDPEAEEEDEGETESEEEEDDEPKARRRSGKRAAKHRSPVASGFALVRSPEAKGREKLAASLGEKVAAGKLTYKEASALLSQAPKKSSLAEAMRGRDVNPGASTAPGGGQKKADIQASWDKAFKKVASFGRRQRAA